MLVCVSVVFAESKTSKSAMVLPGTNATITMMAVVPYNPIALKSRISKVIINAIVYSLSGLRSLSSNGIVNLRLTG